MTKTNLTMPTEILKFNDHKAQPYTVLAAGVTANSEGRKIVKAGTPLPANDGTAKGILLYDVDVTNGNAAGALCYEGAFDAAKIAANGITISAEAKAALPRCTFF
jgi:hypothetical protein